MLSGEVWGHTDTIPTRHSCGTDQAQTMKTFQVLCQELASFSLRVSVDEVASWKKNRAAPEMGRERIGWVRGHWV